MTKEGRPRRGSLQFIPRKRASKMIPRARSWPKTEGLQGFIGYKMGMITAFVKPLSQRSPFAGKEIVKAATVFEVPPMILKSVRLYKKTPYGLKVIGESTSPKPERADFGRLMFQTQPKLAGFPKKKPETVEIGFGGSVDSLLKFASEHMGKEVNFSDAFKANEFVDAIGVTKGKGVQGPVKRSGVRLQPGKDQHSIRKVGSLGPLAPARTSWKVAMAGQMGFHSRTEYNKQVLCETPPVNTKAGWKDYGVARSRCAIVMGTVPGSPKRAIKLRKAVRPNKKTCVFEIQKIVANGEVKRV
jgi:large subunit ribosomal protein L3